eukprot:3762977-Amphidinium_carterae.1
MEIFKLQPQGIKRSSLKKKPKILVPESCFVHLSSASVRFVSYESPFADATGPTAAHAIDVVTTSSVPGV